MSVKMKMKMRNWPHRSDINRPMSRYRHKYSKYKKCLGMMILKQQLSNTWES